MKCGSCGEDMVPEIVAVDVVIAGRRASIDQPGWYCWSCKLGVHDANDRVTADDAVGALLGKRRQGRPGKIAYRQNIR